MTQKINLRRCVISNKSFPKSELIRIVKTKDGTFFVNSNKQGRGVYVLKKAPFDEVRKKRILDRAFKTKVSNDIYEKLISILKGELHGE